MNFSSCFVLISTLLISGFSKKPSYDSQPKIYVSKGNLVFNAALEKHIILRTSPNAGVLLNNVDLITTLSKADNATKLIDLYQKTFSSYVGRIIALEQRYLDSDLNALRQNNGTIGSGTGVTIQDHIRRLNIRIRALQRRFVVLQGILYKDECNSSPCKNGGSCQDVFNGFICSCIEGWEGKTCEKDVNECARFIGTDLGCQHGSTCINKPGTYECLCPTGWYGIHCNTRKADCSSSGTELCGHGTCVPQNNQDGYKCICDQGWTTDGTNLACTKDVDECSMKHPSCSPLAPCVNLPGTYHCGTCTAGYTGNGFHCTDIDECAMLNNGGCSLNPRVQCINTPGSSICGVCPPGYSGDGKVCAFVGICNINNGGCHYLAQCRDNPRISSTYIECICPIGYSGNGIGQNGCLRSNQQLNPCSPNPCENGVCSANNATGDYICNCRLKYTGRNCDIMKDPCASNPCQNGGTCQNFAAAFYRCKCISGFSGPNCQTESQGCGGSFITENGTLKYPPDNYEVQRSSGLSCGWLIETNASKVLNITFKNFQIESSTAGCSYNWLQIHDGRNTVDKSLGRFCGTKLPLGGHIKSTHNTIYIWFHTALSISKKSHFEISWNSIDPDCGGIITSSSHGTIASPGYPGNYPPNRDCYWELFSISPDKRFLFHFVSLDIGQNKDCTSDYLEIHDVNIYRGTIHPFAKFCNASQPSPLYSPGSRATIHFHSDNKNGYPGFQLTFSIVEGIPGCGGVYTSDQSLIKSVRPERGQGSPFGLTCEYKIQLPKKSKIKYTFLSFNLKYSGSCSTESLEIYEGPNIESPLIGRYCGNTLPGEYTSSSNEITLVSFTRHNSLGEWTLKYETVCGERYTQPEGKFNLTVGSSQNDCEYVIERPPGTIIVLSLRINITSNINCRRYVEVRDGENGNSKLIEKYCGQANSRITSTTNYLWIKMVYPFYPLQQVPVTVAEYTSVDVGCGGVLKEPNGNIAAPTSGGSYLPINTCKWVIIAPPNNVIQLNWITFDLEQSFSCQYDYIQVFDNNTGSGTGELMGKYCGHSNPPTMLTSSNVMTLVFVTDASHNGEGFLTHYTFIPETKVCGGNYFTSSGVLKSPGYPNKYPVNRECTWVITVRSGSQIMLNISDFNVEPYSSCRYDWLEIRNGGSPSSPLIGKYCGKNIPRLISSHANQLYLFFKSDANNAGKGFKINWYSTATGCGGTLSSPYGSIISPNYPLPYDRNTDCTWKITVSAGSKVQVLFADIELEKHSACALDYVELLDGNTYNSKSLGRYCSPGVKPIISTSNKMLVRFRSDINAQLKGFMLQYSTICQNTVKGFRGIIESPNFPNGYPHQQDCVWNITVPSRNQINITFSDFQLERSLTQSLKNNTCLFDYVEIKYIEPSDESYSEEADIEFTKYGRYCGDNNPGLITLNADQAQIHFVTDNQLSGLGFRLEWQIFGCGGILTKDSGTIESPNYPKAYPKSVECDWQIEVAYGKSIEIYFKEIDIEKDNSCEYDSVNIYNGPDETYNLLAKFCHQQKPIRVTSSGNKMYVKFTADFSYEGRGFSANYSTVSTKCGGIFTAPKGAIMSPNYPKNYNRNDTCGWLIDIDENHSIELEFEEVDLLMGTGCNSNYIKVYDGPTEGYPVLAKICGSNKPNSTIKSTYNHMYIEFRSHAFITSKGFKANYYKACGTQITTQGSGNIKISQNDFTERMNNNCSWTISSVDLSKHISLTITHMASNAFCDNNYYTGVVYNGQSNKSPVLNQFCGNQVPPTLVSDGSSLHIEVTEPLDFFATYSVLDSHCGGTLTAVKGIFATPGYPKKYLSDVQCEWTLAVAPGNHISLTFSYFELPESENCNSDYLEIRSNNSSGKLLGLFCGKNKPGNITHSGSLWMLFKSSKLDASSNTGTTANGFRGQYALNIENELTGPKGVIASPMYPVKTFTMGTINWRITVSTNKVILLTFKDFYVELQLEDTCYFASLEIYDGVDENAPLLKTYCGLEIPDPIKSSSNIIYIKFQYFSSRTGYKFLLEWLEVDNLFKSTAAPSFRVEGCGSSEPIDVSALHNYTLTSPGYPTGYAPNLNCEWIFTTIPMNHLKIYFTHIDLHFYFRTHICQMDYIDVYQKQKNDVDWNLIKRTCTSDNSSLIEASNLLKVVFKTNRFFNGTGFKAEILEACGGSLTDPSGYIIFNNHSSARHSNFQVVCQWDITARSGRTIILTFEKMNIPHDESKGCENYIMIRNGKSSDSPILGNGKYCGTEKPTNLVSTGNSLYLKYSGSPNIMGFTIKYQEHSISCGGEVVLTQFDNYTEINSLNYPNIPPPFSECLWIFRAPPGETLRVDFEERFDLTHTKDCEKEYVEVRDGGTEFSPLIGRFCKDTPSTQFSTDNIMLIKFFTNVEDPKNGFKARISLGNCGGTIRGYDGTITSPTFGISLPMINCTWHIIGPIDHFLTLSFTKVNLQISPNCSFSSVEVSEVNKVTQNTTILKKLCGFAIPTPISTGSNEAIIHLVARHSAIKLGGFTMKFNTSQKECGGTLNQESGIIESPGYPVMYHNRRSCQWKIEVPSGRRITLEVLDLDFDEQFIKDQTLAIFDGYRIDLAIAFVKQGDNKKMFESSDNKMLIYFWSNGISNHRGFKAKFTSDQPSLCSGDFNQTAGVITQPSIRTTLYLCQWIHFSKKRWNQTFALSVTMSTNNTSTRKCAYSSKPVISVSPHEDRQTFALICKSTSTPIVVRSPFPITKLRAVTARKYELNFTVSYETYSCGGIIFDESGYISSPGFPNKPQKSYECAWLLRLGSEQTVKINIVNLDLGNDCEKDFLTIYNGNLPTHPRIGKYCKNNKPDKIISQSNMVWIEYKFEQGGNGNGFNLTYEPEIAGCGGIFHEEKRIIQTPNYGKGYPNNAECLWEIISKPGYHIRLQFIDRFFLEQSENCQNDFVEIIDWKDGKWVSMGKKCGRNIPNELHSTSDRMQILFRSNNKTTASGFKAQWDWRCGGIFEATRTPQYIVSPGYPDIYASNLVCVYTITTKSRVLKIEFEDFNLENGSSNCKYDNLTISTRYRVYGARTYCGNNMPPAQRVYRLFPAIITFKTDKFTNFKGFRFMYMDESCGGDITNETSIEYSGIKSQGIGFNIPMIQCIWRITAPSDRVVILRIEKLSMNLNSGCVGQTLQIFDGLNTTQSKKLAVLCGKLDNTPIVSLSNTMLVKIEGLSMKYEGFKADVSFAYGPSMGCGGTVNLTETKYVHSPNGLTDLDCHWKITVPTDYNIKIQLTELNIPQNCRENKNNTSNCCAFIEIRDGGSIFSDLLNKMCTGNGQSRQYTTSWNTGYIRMFVPGTNNNVFKATLTPLPSICGKTTLRATSEKQILQSPNYPNPYPEGIKCSWVINSQVQRAIIDIHLKDFDLPSDNKQSDNSCDQDKLEIIEDRHRQILSEGLGPSAIYNGNSKGWSYFSQYYNRHAFCGKSDQAFEYYTMGNSITLTFASIDTPNKGKGFQLEYSLAGCNRNYTDTQGRLKSTNSDKNSCIITITVPENRTISVYFNSFLLHSRFYLANNNCTECGMEIREKNSTGQQLLRACGVRIPNPVFSHTNQLWIHIWYPQNPVPWNAYDLTYTSSNERGCGGNLYNSKGKFTSPFYPNTFRNFSTCEWNIKVPVGLKAAVKFTEFNIQGQCDTNNLVVTTYNGVAPTEHRYCRNDRIAPLHSNSNIIKVTYQSSRNNGGTGWIALFQALTDESTIW